MNTFETLTGLPINHEQFVNDWDKRYNNTIMLYKGEPIFIHGRESYFIKASTLSQKSDLSFDSSSKQEIDLEPWLPDNGYYGNKDYPLISLACIPSRQWKRSYCNSLYKDFSGIHNNLNTTIRILNYCTAIVHSEYHKEPQRIEGTDDYYMRISIDMVFWKGSILFKGMKVGEVNFQKKQLKLTIPYLHQEVSDILHRQGLTSWNLM